MKYTPNPKLDLVLEKILDVSPEQAFKAWTTPALVEQFFAPKPWQTSNVKIDLRPGGKFATTMKGPEGQEFSGEGCYLEIEPNRKLVWTDALGADYRPNSTAFFTGILTFEPHGNNQCKYTAIALHKDEATRKQHAEMGFETGWGIVADQLVSLMKNK